MSELPNNSRFDLMDSNDSSIDKIISLLYRGSTRVDPVEFRQWGLEQIHRVIDFDAALWATGHLELQQFHYAAQIGLDDNYPDQLRKTIDINPFKQGVLRNIGKPVTMSEVYPDQEFYNSPLYQQLFEPYGIERIMGSAHLDSRSGLYSIVSLYRKQRELDFCQKERKIMERLTYHLDLAASHAYFVHLELKQQGGKGVAAICDQQGYYYQVQENFLNIIESSFSNHKAQKLPFETPPFDSEVTQNDLIVKSSPFGKLTLITIRQTDPLDILTEREKEIVDWVTKGLTFKEVGKKLEVAPSTVSNHLYRIYQKLGITSRTELARMLFDG